MKKTKKQPFFNVIKRYLRLLEIECNTINSGYLVITDGFLNGVSFQPDANRCTVVKRHSQWDKVHISLDLEVNYSFEVLLYKLFKFHILNETNYTIILRKLSSYGKAS